VIYDPVEYIIAAAIDHSVLVTIYIITATASDAYFLRSSINIPVKAITLQQLSIIRN